MSYQARYCLLLLLALTLLEEGSAQSVYGTIKGALTLSSGTPVEQARVLVTAVDRGDELRFSATTDKAGYFIVSNLPPGAYRIQMQKDGFRTHEEPLVPVAADSTSEVNVKLTQGDAATKEVGDGSAVSILKVDRTDVSTSFTRQEITALPIRGQNISVYELLVPGAWATSSVLNAQQNPQQGSYVSISGQHFSGTSFMLDGTTNRDPLQGIVVLNPSLESVGEVKITTQNYGAEFGPASAGVVSVQTKSGTNVLHGAMFGFWQPASTQATSPDFGISSILQNSNDKHSDFGGALSGPLMKNRLFIFGDYRGVRISSTGDVLLTVPSKTVHETCLGAASPTTNCDLSEYVGGGVKLTSYSNGLIPNSILSPQMLPFFRMIPLPNNGSGLAENYAKSGVDTYSNNSFNVRSDYLASSKLKMFGRYSFSNFSEHGAPAFGNPGGFGTNPSRFAGSLEDRNQGVSAGFSDNLTSSLLTDFRFGFFRYNLALDSLDIGTTPATQAGIEGLNLQGDLYSSGMPDLQLANPRVKGLPVARNQDFLRLGYSQAANACNCPLREREQQFQFVSNWTKVLDKHEFRWGADFRYLQNFRLSSDSRRAGHLQFASGTNKSQTTGFSLSDFLLGLVSAFDRAYNPVITNAGERQNRLFFYGEDTWRATSRLTLNYGLRWEIYLPQSVTGRGAGGWLELGSGISPADDRFLVAGQAGSNMQGNVRTTLHNLGPRVGVAYQMNPSTVIRAGYGRAFDTGFGGSIFSRLSKAGSPSTQTGIPTCLLRRPIYASPLHASCQRSTSLQRRSRYVTSIQQTTNLNKQICTRYRVVCGCPPWMPGTLPFNTLSTAVHISKSLMSETRAPTFSMTVPARCPTTISTRLR
jgi:hypothetical protein